MLGMVEFQTKELKKAFGALTKAVKLDPNLLDAQVQLGRIFLVANDKDKSLEKATFVLSKDPEHEDGLLLKAAWLAAEQKGGEAEPILQSVIEKNPKKADAYILLSRIRLGNNDPDGASQTLRDLLAYDDTNTAARLILVDILEKKMDLAAAEREYKAHIGQNPDNDSLRLLLANFYDRTDRGMEAEEILKDFISSDPEDQNLRLGLARFYAKKERHDAMLEVLRQAVKDLPGQYGAYEVLAGYYLGQKETEKATSLLNQFMERVKEGPDYLKAKFFKATVCFREEKTAEGLQLVAEILKDNPKDVRAHALKGDMLATQKDFAGAIAEYRAALHEEPENTLALLSLAKAHLFNNEPALEVNSDSQEALFHLARLEQAVGSVDKALKKYEEIRGKSPENLGIAMVIATLLDQQGKHGQAREIYEEVLEKKPDLLVAANNLAFYYAEYDATEENLAKAERLMSPLIQKHKDAPNLADTAAWVYFRQGKFERARDLLLEVEEKARATPVISFHLGMIYYGLGEDDGARKYLQHALESEEAFMGREEAEKTLKELK